MLTTPPQPRLTGGSERPTPRCGNYRDVIDALDSKYPHPEHVEAVAHMCAACPIRERCHRDHDGEQWLVNVQRGAKRRPALGARQQARLDGLESAVRMGLTVHDAAVALGTTETALWEWCKKYGQGHLFVALKGAA